LKRAAQEGEIDLYFVDESGFAPTLPGTSTWAKEGVRAVVRAEATERRRVNAIGAVAPYGAQQRLVWRTTTDKVDSAMFLRFLWCDVAQLRGPVGRVRCDYQRERPCVVVVDNYSVHHSALVKKTMPYLRFAGIVLFYLPPYSPELNPIEGVWRQIKHAGMPQRSYTTEQDLQRAVEAAMTDYAQILAARPGRHDPELLPYPTDTQTSANYLPKAA
jgi:hypothetical protein